MPGAYLKRPEGASACSHGWSNGQRPFAKPVESSDVSTRPGGAAEAGDYQIPSPRRGESREDREPRVSCRVAIL